MEEDEIIAALNMTEEFNNTLQILFKEAKQTGHD